jgi:transposase-like protein
MGQVLHGGATTTEAIRRAIQHRQESLKTLARRHGINQKTVAKCRRRSSAADLPTGPREPPSNSPSRQLSMPQHKSRNRARMRHKHCVHRSANPDSQGS